MNIEDLRAILADYLPASSIEDIVGKLARCQADPATLTIVANQGVHHIDREQLRGEICVATQGQLALGSIESLHQEYRKAISKVAEVLKRQHWSRVYLLPSGPTTLSLQIKALVRQVTGKDTVDLFTDKASGAVWEIEVDVREVASLASVERA